MLNCLIQHSPRSNSRCGYTLVEMMVVLALIGIVATMVIFGLGKFNNDQSVINAQREFIGNLNAVQNRVNTGGYGIAYKAVNFSKGGSSYTYTDTSGGSQNVPLPPGVSIFNIYTVDSLGVTTPISDTSMTLCFAHPTISYWKDPPGSCNSSCPHGNSENANYVYFACSCTLGACSTIYNGGGNTQTLQVDFTKIGSGSKIRSVRIEGSGININRIYAK